MPTADQELERLLDGVAERLTKRYGIDARAARALVHEQAHELRGARVTDFVPVLVERRVAARVRAGAPQVDVAS